MGSREGHGSPDNMPQTLLQGLVSTFTWTISLICKSKYWMVSSHFSDHYFCGKRKWANHQEMSGLDKVQKVAPGCLVQERLEFFWEFYLVLLSEGKLDEGKMTGGTLHSANKWNLSRSLMAKATLPFRLCCLIPLVSGGEHIQGGWWEQVDGCGNWWEAAAGWSAQDSFFLLRGSHPGTINQ